MLVVLAGPPCSGKTTLGAWLAKTLPAVHLEVDALLTQLLPGSDRRLEHRLFAYKVAVLGANTALGRGLTLILDGTYSRRQVRQQLLELLEDVEHDFRLIVVEFSVSPEVAVSRFNQRAEHHAADLTPEIVRARAELYPYGSGTALVNSESSLEEVQASVINAIRSGSQDFDRDRWVRIGL